MHGEKERIVDGLQERDEGSGDCRANAGGHQERQKDAVVDFVVGDVVRQGFGFANPNHAAAAVCALTLGNLIYY